MTSGLDFTKAARLVENSGIAFQGVTMGGPFDLTADEARRLLAAPNPDLRSNGDVVREVVNAQDITSRSRHEWVVDFGASRSEHEAALYEAPFEYILPRVRPFRMNSRRPAYVQRWWLPMEARPGMRSALNSLKRYIATPITSKHRLFVWMPVSTLPLVPVVAIARDDDYTFGVLHSRAHELRARATGTQLREVESGFRYTPTTTFETFPFPQATDDQRERVGEAARRLDELRDGWLNPTGLDPADFEKRSLTNLYNQRPTWLDHAHAALDALVFTAYGWPANVTDTAILERLLALNAERAGARDEAAILRDGGSTMA